MDREAIVPPGMENLLTEKGYTPALRVGSMLFVAGQVGRTPDLKVIEDPEAQFVACWENLRKILAAAGCTFEDVVDLTTYHVEMRKHHPVFYAVKNRVFPRGTCPWTAIGVETLSTPGLFLEVKATALIPGR
jgi:enamine deaminase RidA (YjgF/YER057c/UK114 family)